MRSRLPISRTFIAFKLVSGLKVNFKKNALVAVGDAVSTDISEMVFGCPGVLFGFNNLGIALGSKSKSLTVWDTILHKFQQRLNTWQRRYLTKGGRLMLIQGVLSILPIYYLTLFQMPASVENQMISIIRKFLWGSSNSIKKSWVGWKRIRLPKERGGVGIKKLRIMNTALHAKWVWRYEKEKKVFMEVYCNQKFGGHVDALFPNDCARMVGKILWTGILKSKPIIQQNSTLIVFSGNGVFLWEDKWKGLYTLVYIYMYSF